MAQALLSQDSTRCLQRSPLITEHSVETMLAACRAAISNGEDVNALDTLPHVGHNEGRPLNACLRRTHMPGAKSIVENLPVIKLLLETRSRPLAVLEICWCYSNTYVARESRDGILTTRKRQGRTGQFGSISTDCLKKPLLGSKQRKKTAKHQTQKRGICQSQHEGERSSNAHTNPQYPGTSQLTNEDGASGARCSSRVTGC
jgi:hypothetical protein